MKFLFFLSLFLNWSLVHADEFDKEARALATDLKMSLMKNLSEKIAKDGPVAAIPFCHENVKPLAKGAAGDRMNRYEFGRTSHKLRNPNNHPQSWAQSTLEEFKGKKKGEMTKAYVILKLDNGKRVYMEPIYIEAKCLLCHGDSLEKNIQNKIQENYPKDQAVNFELDEFRGFLWVKEK